MNVLKANSSWRPSGIFIWINLAQLSSAAIHKFEQALTCSAVFLNDKILLFFFLHISFIFFIFVYVALACTYPWKENTLDTLNNFQLAKFHKPVWS